MAVKYVKVYTDRVALALSARGGLYWDARDAHINVPCPFCGEPTRFYRDGSHPVAGCEHWDSLDYKAPDDPHGLPVWFRDTDGA